MRCAGPCFGGGHTHSGASWYDCHDQSWGWMGCLVSGRRAPITRPIKHAWLLHATVQRGHTACCSQLCINTHLLLLDLKQASLGKKDQILNGIIIKSTNQKPKLPFSLISPFYLSTLWLHVVFGLSFKFYVAWIFDKMLKIKCND